ADRCPYDSALQRWMVEVAAGSPARRADINAGVSEDDVCRGGGRRVSEYRARDEHALTDAVDERELRAAASRQHGRRFWQNHARGLQNRHGGDGGRKPFGTDRVARVRVRREARRSGEATAAGGALSPATRLARVVRGDGAVAAQRLVPRVARTHTG